MASGGSCQRGYGTQPVFGRGYCVHTLRGQVRWNRAHVFWTAAVHAAHLQDGGGWVCVLVFSCVFLFMNKKV
jgi:hypothetical protein